MYRISYILKNSNGGINNGAQMVKEIYGMFDSIQKFRECGFVGRLEDVPALAKAFKQLLAQIRHVAGTVVEGANLRTICAPDDGLKGAQRQILDQLGGIPSHHAAHGFIRGRDSMTCASAHTSYWGERPSSLVILNMDAKNFFPSITSQVVRRALAANHVPEGVINKAVILCMAHADESMASAVIDGLFRLVNMGLLRSAARDITDEALNGIHRRMTDLFSGSTVTDMPDGSVRKLAFAICQGFLSLGPSVTMVNKFLPQGAPTSPFLSNMAMKIVDIRLHAMAASFGGFYTRYADDLTVSWPAGTKGKIIDGMYRCATETLKEYGVAMNRRKKRVMGTGVRQDIVGLCVNSGLPTVSRTKRMRIRAAIHNELVRGSQNFRTNKRKPAKFENYNSKTPSFQRTAFLMGHIGYVGSAHPGEAEKYKWMMRNAMHPVDGPSFDLHSSTIEHNDFATAGAEGIGGVSEFFFHPPEEAG